MRGTLPAASWRSPAIGPGALRSFFRPVPTRPPARLRRKSSVGPHVDAMTVDLEVVIVSHRDEAWLKPCIDSLEGAAGACTFRATIVENGGAPIGLAEGPNRRVLYMPNLGFAAANNLGARGSPADHLLFLNPDTELTHGTLERLVKTL